MIEPFASCGLWVGVCPAWVPTVWSDSSARLETPLCIWHKTESCSSALSLWAGLNWLLDAASLWSFVSAFGHFVDPIELFAAYGIANVLGAIPITPGGLGVIEASAGTLLVSFGLTRNVATLAVLGWRLVNFWLPIPLGAGAYIPFACLADPGYGHNDKPSRTWRLKRSCPARNPSPTRPPGTHHLDIEPGGTDGVAILVATEEAPPGAEPPVLLMPRGQHGRLPRCCSRPARACGSSTTTWGEG